MVSQDSDRAPFSYQRQGQRQPEHRQRKQLEHHENGWGDALAIKLKKVNGADKPNAVHKPASHPNGLSFFEAFQSTVKAVIGTGILALPHAFQLSGAIFGPLFMCSIAFYTMHVNLLLTECYRLRPTRATYSGLCESILGKPGKIIGAANLITMQVFVCAAHFTFMGKNFASALHSWGFASVDLRMAVIMCGILISGCTLLKDITFLKNTSLLGNLAVLVSLVSIIIYASPSFSVDNIPLTTTLPDLAVFFSMCIYMFNGIGEVLPIATSMHDTDSYPSVLACSFGVLVFSYLIFGLAVSCSFGSHTQGLVFENLDGPIVAFVKVFHGLAVFCTVPLKYFSGINDGLVPLMDTVFGTSSSVNTGEQPDESCGKTMLCQTFRTGMRLAMVVISVAITLTVPDFAFLVALVGGFSITIVAFILPPLMFMVLAMDPSNKIPFWKQLLNGCLLTFGISMCLVFTYKNIQDKLQSS